MTGCEEKSVASFKQAVAVVVGDSVKTGEVLEFIWTISPDVGSSQIVVLILQKNGKRELIEDYEIGKIF